MEIFVGLIGSCSVSPTFPQTPDQRGHDHPGSHRLLEHICWTDILRRFLRLCQDDDRQFSGPGMGGNLLFHRQTVEPWQREIEHESVDVIPLEQPDRFQRAAGFKALEPDQSQGQAQLTTEMYVVLHDENGLPCDRHHR
jgi:hypothetical protein